MENDRDTSLQSREFLTLFLPRQNFWLVSGDGDWPRKHPLLASVADPARYSLLEQVAGAKKTNRGPATWYAVFLQWALPCSWDAFADNADEAWSDAEVQAACDASPWFAGFGGAGVYNPRCRTSDSFGAPPGACGPRASTAVLSDAEFSHAAAKRALHESPGSGGLASGAVPACTAWPVQLLLCGGRPCFEGHLPDELYAAVESGATTVLGVHPDHFYDCLNVFLNSDTAHGLTSPGFNCEDPAEGRSKSLNCNAVPRNATSLSRRVWRGPDGEGDLDFAKTNVWCSDLEFGKQWVTMIDSVRRRVNDFRKAADVEAYPSGTEFKFYSQFRWIVKAMVRGLGFGILAISLIVAAFFFAGLPATVAPVVRAARACWMSALLASTIALVVLTFVALMGHADILLNCFTVVTVIMSLGVSVEFLAHTAYAALVEPGARDERARNAVVAYLPPVIDGACTTFLGFCALAFSRYEYIKLYYFVVYSIMLAVGLFFGAVTLPALLATADLP